MLKFATLFPDFQQVHLTKDVGIIPMMMAKNYGYKVKIICYENKKNISLESNINLEIEQLKRITGNKAFDGGWYLIKNARYIDVLNIYHYSKYSFIWIFIYHVINRKGKIYLKLDMNTIDGMKMRMKKGTLKYWITKIILSFCSLISTETKEMTKHINQNWPVKAIYIPNGICKNEIRLDNKKEKIILTVSRIGTIEKATDILLEAFKKASNFLDGEWKLKLVGPIEESFIKYKEQFFQENPKLIDKIEFVGPISDRRKLAKIYESSAIFCLPSRTEGFPIVLSEAMAKGNYIIASDIASVREIIHNGEFGKLVEIDNCEALKNAIIESCTSYNQLLDQKKLKNWLLTHFTWEEQCQKIVKYLNK